MSLDEQSPYLTQVNLGGREVKSGKGFVAFTSSGVYYAVHRSQVLASISGSSGIACTAGPDLSYLCACERFAKICTCKDVATNVTVMTTDELSCSGGLHGPSGSENFGATICDQPAKVILFHISNGSVHGELILETTCTFWTVTDEKNNLVVVFMESLLKAAVYELHTF